jgi:hypothetical protein
VLIILGLRYYLVRQNNIREALEASATTEEEKERFSEYGYLEVPDKNAPGGVTRVKVEKRFLDLTDKQNLSFRYAL